MGKVKLFVQQTLQYEVEIEVEVSDDCNLEDMSNKFERIVRHNSDEGPEDVAFMLQDQVQGLKIIDAPHWRDYRNDPMTTDLEYDGFETV